MNENKFSGKGKIYAQFRPGYPQSLIDWLCGEAGLSEASIVADIGSGTGIFTGQLLECSGTVYAVEPNADMRAVAENNLHKFSNFISVGGTAEHTALADCSVDFVTAAQAFHWFDRQSFRTECRRILKPDGKVLLVWNSRDEASELVIENDKINRKYCPDFKGFSGGMLTETAHGDFSDFFTGSCERKAWENPLFFDEQGFIGRNLSASYGLKEGDENYGSYIGELRTLFHRYSQNGILIMPNLTTCYIGSVSSAK